MAGLAGIMAEKQRAWSEQAERIEQWLAAQHQEVARLSGIIEQSQARDEYHRFATKATTDTAGAANHTIQGIQGWHYELINVAVTSVTGETGALLIYLNSPHPSNLLHVVALGQYTSDAFPEGCYVPQGVQLYYALTGSVVSQDIYVNILAKKLPTQDPFVTTAGGEE